MNLRIASYQNYLTKGEPSLRISKQALAAVATWCDNHQRDVVLADIPQKLFLQNQLQQHHLLDVVEMLRKVFYLSYGEESSCFKACLELFPDVCLHLRDEYTAALIKSLCDREEIQTLFVVCGLGQSRSVPHYMSNSPKTMQQVTQ